PLQGREVAQQEDMRRVEYDDVGLCTDDFMDVDGRAGSARQAWNNHTPADVGTPVGGDGGPSGHAVVDSDSRERGIGGDMYGMDYGCDGDGGSETPVRSETPVTSISGQDEQQSRDEQEQQQQRGQQQSEPQHGRQQLECPQQRQLQQLPCQPLLQERLIGAGGSGSLMSGSGAGLPLPPGASRELGLDGQNDRGGGSGGGLDNVSACMATATAAGVALGGGGGGGTEMHPVLRAALGEASFTAARATMMRQQSVFVQQLCELHKLVRVQQVLWSELGVVDPAGMMAACQAAGFAGLGPTGPIPFPTAPTHGSGAGPAGEVAPAAMTAKGPGLGGSRAPMMTGATNATAEDGAGGSPGWAEAGDPRAESAAVSTVQQQQRLAALTTQGNGMHPSDAVRQVDGGLRGVMAGREAAAAAMADWALAAPAGPGFSPVLPPERLLERLLLDMQLLINMPRALRERVLRIVPSDRLPKPGSFPPPPASRQPSTADTGAAQVPEAGAGAGAGCGGPPPVVRPAASKLYTMMFGTELDGPAVSEQPTVVQQLRPRREGGKKTAAVGAAASGDKGGPVSGAGFRGDDGARGAQLDVPGTLPAAGGSGPGHQQQQPQQAVASSQPPEQRNGAPKCPGGIRGPSFPSHLAVAHPPGSGCNAGGAVGGNLGGGFRAIPPFASPMFEAIGSRFDVPSQLPPPPPSSFPGAVFPPSMTASITLPMPWALPPPTTTAAATAAAAAVAAGALPPQRSPSVLPQPPPPLQPPPQLLIAAPGLALPRPPSPFPGAAVRPMGQGFMLPLGPQQQPPPYRPPQQPPFGPGGVPSGAAQGDFGAISPPLPPLFATRVGMPGPGPPPPQPPLSRPPVLTDPHEAWFAKHVAGSAAAGAGGAGLWAARPSQPPVAQLSLPQQQHQQQQQQLGAAQELPANGTQDGGIKRAEGGVGVGADGTSAAAATAATATAGLSPAAVAAQPQQQQQAAFPSLAGDTWAGAGFSASAVAADMVLVTSAAAGGGGAGDDNGGEQLPHVTAAASDLGSVNRWWRDPNSTFGELGLVDPQALGNAPLVEAEEEGDGDAGGERPAELLKAMPAPGPLDSAAAAATTAQPTMPLKKRGKLLAAANTAAAALAAADPATAAAVAALLASADLGPPGAGPGAIPLAGAPLSLPHPASHAAQQAVLLATTRLLQSSAFKLVAPRQQHSNRGSNRLTATYTATESMASGFSAGGGGAGSHWGGMAAAAMEAGRRATAAAADGGRLEGSENGPARRANRSSAHAHHSSINGNAAPRSGLASGSVRRGAAGPSAARVQDGEASEAGGAAASEVGGGRFSGAGGAGGGSSSARRRTGVPGGKGGNGGVG
ncbi:hypothetical protein VaNZ11_011285, partial [Volvox africanus]